MIITIMIMSILLVINSGLIFLMLAGIYGKINDLIEIEEKKCEEQTN